MSVFKNQGYFVLTLNTGINISTATVTRINYKKPNGVTGYFEATISETTKLIYQLTNDDLDIAGLWQLQAYVEIGGLKAYGEIVYQEIKKPI
jgi:hypothetical protein